MAGGNTVKSLNNKALLTFVIDQAEGTAENLVGTVETANLEECKSLIDARELFAYINLDMAVPDARPVVVASHARIPFLLFLGPSPAGNIDVLFFFLKAVWLWAGCEQLV